MYWSWNRSPFDEHSQKYVEISSINAKLFCICTLAYAVPVRLHRAYRHGWPISSAVKLVFETGPDRLSNHNPVFCDRGRGCRFKLKLSRRLTQISKNRGKMSKNRRLLLADANFMVALTLTPSKHYFKNCQLLPNKCSEVFNLHCSRLIWNSLSIVQENFFGNLKFSK